ncbi:MAG: aminopeptidase P family protein [Spirochaetaceae bacterium]
MTVQDKLEALRRRMRDADLAAYIVPSADPHQSEYVADCFQLRQWLSGFQGSAGVVVVTADHAGLWTDSRYYLEAGSVLEGSGIDLFKADEYGVPSYPKWLISTLEPGARVGVWAESISVGNFRQVEETLRDGGLSLVATEDLVGAIWDNRPDLPKQPAFLVPTAYAGRTRSEKLADIRSALEDERLDAIVLPALDEIAWLFNLRGQDVPYNPVALAYAVVSAEEALLFMDAGKLSPEDRSALENDAITVRPYDEVCRALKDLPEGWTVGVDPDQVTMALRDCISPEATVREPTSPVKAAKARKNSTELDGMRRAMVKDAVAMERFLYWLEQAVPTGLVTEGKAAEVLREFRAEQEDFVGESFQTISGYEGHGAIVHYRVTHDSDVHLRSEGLYLVDSGGQYRHGTTDITRVTPLGEVSPQMREDFTLVLKGHIALATQQFPKGTTGHQLDALARSALWQEGRNYGHGTGHGVGCFLNVHEGPQSISTRQNSVALEPGMVVSNEPGVYRPGEYGIRIENLVVVTPTETTAYAEFYGFQTLTLCHIDTRLVERTMLRPDERDWLNSYNAEVYRAVADKLEEPIRQWLAERTAPL